MYILVILYIILCDVYNAEMLADSDYLVKVCA